MRSEVLNLLHHKSKYLRDVTALESQFEVILLGEVPSFLIKQDATDAAVPALKGRILHNWMRVGIRYAPPSYDELCKAKKYLEENEARLVSAKPEIMVSSRVVEHPESPIVEHPPSPIVAPPPSCSGFDEDIVLYFLNNLSEQKRDDLSTHLQQCVQCRLKIIALEDAFAMRKIARSDSDKE